MVRRSWLAGVAVVFAAWLAAGALPAAAQSATQGTVGYDVSWPQCTSTGSSSPTGTFAIIGVNDGKPFSVNPCVASEVTNAAGLPLSYYDNTANPGPRSPNWPKGKTAGGVYCPSLSHYKTGSSALSDCSYVYGWDAAANAFADAPTAAATSQWWLDVESANSWLSDTAANIRDLDGEMGFLRSQGLTDASIGIYTNSSSWSSITGSTTHFANNAWWAPGLASGQSGALAACSHSSVTGGYIRYVQWVANNFDMDYDCGTLA